MIASDQNEAERRAIARCQQGDMAGLELLIARYQLPAIRLAYLLLGDSGLAEDVVQESFLLAYRGIGHFRLGQPFAPWFYRIVTNAARQQRRSARSRRETSLDELSTEGDEPLAEELPIRVAAAASISDPVAHAERAEERAALLDVLATLPTKQREAIVLRYYFGYSDQQIAAILGCRHGAVRQRLHAGRAGLQQAIQRRHPWLLTSLSMVPNAIL